MNKTLIFIPLVLFLLLALAAALALNRPAGEAPEEIKDIPAFAVKGLDSHALEGETALVNFFASWCLPCEAEHPLLTKYGTDIPIYGIAFMDKPENLDAFLARLGNPYRAIGHDDNGTAAIAFGIEGVPVTFFISGGKIIHRHEGPLMEDEVEAFLKTVKK